jgi:hypothetical protein
MNFKGGVYPKPNFKVSSEKMDLFRIRISACLDQEWF